MGVGAAADGPMDARGGMMREWNMDYAEVCGAILCFVAHA